eukprot:scaffold249800_cov33-Tisochrysis_lutea.AAC.1
MGGTTWRRGVLALWMGALPSVHHIRVFELLRTEQQSPQTGEFKRLQSFSTTKCFPLPERIAEYFMPDVARRPTSHCQEDVLCS